MLGLREEENTQGTGAQTEEEAFSDKQDAARSWFIADRTRHKVKILMWKSTRRLNELKIEVWTSSADPDLLSQVKAIVKRSGCTILEEARAFRRHCFTCI